MVRELDQWFDFEKALKNIQQEESNQKEETIHYITGTKIGIHVRKKFAEACIIYNSD